ncbi:hypothetical protein K440DRAFT_636830 [Wilcoxina mikolae CBS 423.85]|nr:hypothetical protein K440DRAFT_636830 [Wilcoxina mikolae CBS 423.85]
MAATTAPIVISVRQCRQDYSALLPRLHKDLAELSDHPYPGITIHHHDSSLRDFCLHLEPRSGPFAGLRLHFEVTLPISWPHQPPKIRSSTHLDHPNVFGSYICCDLLRASTESGGYTPAFTLRGLLLQFLSFFSSETVEQDEGGIHVLLGNRGEPVEMYRNVENMDIEHVYNRYTYDDVNIKEQAVLKAKWEEEVADTERNGGKPLAGVIQMERRGCKTAVWWPRGKEGKGSVVKEVWMIDRFKQTLPMMRQFQCPKCGYNMKEGCSVEIPENYTPAKDRPYTFPSGVSGTPVCTPQAPQVVETQSSATESPTSSTRGNPLDKLSPELLLAISDHLQTETMNLLSLAYPRFSTIVAYYKLHLYRELTCFFLRTPIIDRNILLGTGVNYDPSTGFISSAFDWLSSAAFTSFDVRTAVDKSPITHFIPLAFGTAHFERVMRRGILWPCLQKLAKDTAKPPPKWRSTVVAAPLSQLEEQAQCLRVLYKLCTSLTVQLMNTTDAALSSSSNDSVEKTLLFSSEKVCIGYLQLYHLLLCILRSHPTLHTRELTRLRRFRDSPDARAKSITPDLGELLVCCAAVAGSSTSPSDTISWPNDLLAPFIREVLTRNVLWLLRAHPELEVLESSPTSNYRITRTFAAGKTSLRLVMFQTLFWDTFIVPHLKSPETLEKYFGFPEPGSGVAAEMVKGIREIYEVKTWTRFFTRVGFEEGRSVWVKDGGVGLCRELKEAVKRSGRVRYHKPIGGGAWRMVEMRRKEDVGFV